MSDTIDTFVGRYSAYTRSGGSSSSPLELEIRFKNTSYGDFLKIADRLVNDGFSSSLTKSVSTVIRVNNEDTESIVREVLRNSSGKKDLFKRKTNVFPPYHDSESIIPYKVSCCEEETLDRQDMRHHAFSRVKLRTSFTKDECPWRYDLTVLRHVDKNGAYAIPEIAKTMFSPFSISSNSKEIIKDLGTFIGGKERLYSYEVEAEYIGPQTKASVVDIKNAIIYIVGGVKPDYVHDMVFNTQIDYIADSIGYQGRVYRHSLKEILPQVRSLSRHDYQEMYPPTGWTITEKLDGERSVLVCSKEKTFIVTTTISEIDYKSEVSIVAEGEYVNGTIYLFDVMLFDKDLVFKYSYTDRLVYIQKILDLGIANVKSKTFITLKGDDSKSLKSEFDNLESQSAGLHTDGIIFVQDNKDYLSTRSLKWKSLEQTTIDFLARRYDYQFRISAPAGYDLYFLFVGISINMFHVSSMHHCPNYNKLFENIGRDHPYFPIQFSPSSFPDAFVYFHPSSEPPIDGKIVEMSFDEPKKVWKFMRVREDRTLDYLNGSYFGNDFRIAELTWNNYMDPLLKEYLWEGASRKSYFQEEKSEVYRPQVYYLSFIKERRLNTIARSDWVVDLGSGKGQDLNRYFRNGIRHLVCVDNDKVALAELVKRKYDITKSILDKRRSQGKTTFHAHSGTNLIVIESDISNRKKTAEDIKRYIPEDGVNVVVCNLAIHYFASSKESLNKFISLCKDLLRPGGKLILMCMSGEKIFEKLKSVEYGESWSLYQDGALKNSIRRKFNEKKLMPAGQQIDVLLPFSKGEYYSEFLINTKSLISELNSRGFTVEGDSAQSVISSLSDFEIQKPETFSNLTKEDFEYLKLFVEIVAERK